MRRPSRQRLQALRDYYCEEGMTEIVDGSGDVADLFAEIDALEEALREMHDEVLGKSGSKIRAIARRALAHEEEA